MSYFHVPGNQIELGEVLEPRYGRTVLDRRFYRSSHENHNLYLREMIFEEIRIQHYPTSPSRLNSVYLFSDNKFTMAYLEKINKRGAQIYTIHTSDFGKLGEYDMTWLDLAVWESIEKIREIAHSYWSKENTGNRLLEVLFDGKAIVSNATRI